MSPAMAVIAESTKEDEAIQLERQFQKGVRHLCEHGITKVPYKYILPQQERPKKIIGKSNVPIQNLKLPVIDFSELQSPNRLQVLKTLSDACEQFGFFQLVNHGILDNVTSSMIDVGTRFFELPYEERSKYMSSDMSSLVRYGTSFTQRKDGVFCWRDFLKLTCHNMSDALPHWPSSPMDLREMAATYAKETKCLFLKLMDAILESLGLLGTTKKKIEENDEDILKEFEDGSQLMVVNCYPTCPEPDLTLGMPPHSDYGFLTLLLQDEVEGLQIEYQQQWYTVQPIPNAFVVNVGDHLEIYSNGRYKSVLHRVIVNSIKDRISVASLHSLPNHCIVRPAPNLVNEANPKRYMEADYASFIEYISSCEPKRKNYLESRKLT